MDPNEPGCVPPCADPMDPTSCKDPCIEDPMACGCTTPDCWPEPQPCYATMGGANEPTNDQPMMCDPSDGMAPDNVPGDFGCEGM